MLIRRETELTVERSNIRSVHLEEQQQNFKIGDRVETFGPSNYPSHSHSDVIGWRSAVISNIRGPFASLDFDEDRHPHQLSQIVRVNSIRHEHIETGPLAIDNLARSEVALTNELVQWIS